MALDLRVFAAATGKRLYSLRLINYSLAIKVGGGTAGEYEINNWEGTPHSHPTNQTVAAAVGPTHVAILSMHVVLVTLFPIEVKKLWARSVKQLPSLASGLFIQQIPI